MVLTVPGVEYRQLPGKSTTPLDPRFIVVHTMAGTLVGSEAYFTPDGRPYSHFGTHANGHIRQWQDLRYRAASDRQGNPYSISIENEDHGPAFPSWSGSDVPRFTDAQADSLVVLLSWLCHRFGLPKAAISSSCTHERGIGWHRLGIDPWRREECSSWSSARGKACPGDRRINQLRDEIIPAVSAPEDDMLSTEDKNWLRELAADRTRELKAYVDERMDALATRQEDLVDLLLPWPLERINRKGKQVEPGAPGAVLARPQDRWAIETILRLRGEWVEDPEPPVES